MVRFKNAMVLVAVCIAAPALLQAQECRFLVHGVVTDDGHHSIPGVVVRLGDSTGTATDTTGSFSFNNICKGRYKLSFNAIGYKELQLDADVAEDKFYTVVLPTQANQLGEVIVNGERLHDMRTLQGDELQGKALLQTRGGTLGEALKTMAGLDALQTGPGLYKPVIHGLHSNRVLLINDGVRQQGQQWGAEHAPEIDPFAADKITVVKGAASVRYGADAVGGVVLLDPDPLPVGEAIHGSIYTIGASNGRMGVVSGMLQGGVSPKLQGLNWRVQGTLKQAGNFKTPGYYLINTGLKEDDLSATIGYKRKWINVSAHYSRYNNTQGIFAGAESSSAKDLALKIASPVPLVPSYFSYAINRSYQHVTHELAKLSATHMFANNSKIELTAGRQHDERQEYDAGLPFTSNPDLLAKPQLSFKLVTHTADLVYTLASVNGWSGMMGVTGNTSGNVFRGLRYLIPNYRDYNAGVFAIERYNTGKLTFEAGARYDYRWLRAYQRDATTLELYNTTYQYNNFTGTVGASYRYNAHLTFTANTGTAWRAPSVNEMYINGEHFSNASYERGDSLLKSERSWNTGLSVNYTNDRLKVTADVYYNKIGNYIYSQPQQRSVTLISGTYPLFQFTQHNVDIKGLDLNVQYWLTTHLALQSKTTIVQGYNQTIHDYLIYMPANRYNNSIVYQVHKLWKLTEPYVGVENVTVSKQGRVPPGIDFAPPPAGYSLFNINAGFNTSLFRHQLSVSATAANVTNVTYRDYLNRFRYYCDDLGANYTVRFKYNF